MLSCSWPFGEVGKDEEEMEEEEIEEEEEMEEKYEEEKHEEDKHEDKHEEKEEGKEGINHSWPAHHHDDDGEEEKQSNNERESTIPMKMKMKKEWKKLEGKDIETSPVGGFCFIGGDVHA